MTAQDYIEWVLPDGTTYQARGNIKFIDTPRPNYRVKGLTSLLKDLGLAADRVGLANTGASKMAQVLVALGDGERQITTRFDQWEGSTDTWGSASSGDSPLTKMQIFADDLANQVIDSGSTVELTYGEYSSNGSLDPLDVAPVEPQFPYDITDSTTTFTGELEWVEVVDESEVSMPAP